MGRYYLPLTSSNKKIIWSGAEWPHRELNKMVTQYLSQGKRIIIDMDGFQGRWQYEKPDVIMEKVLAYEAEIVSVIQQIKKMLK